MTNRYLTTVLFAAAYRRNSSHDAAFPVLRGIGDGRLPEAVAPDYVLAETINGLTTHAGHEATVDLLVVLKKNARFHIGSSTTDDLATGEGIFRQHESLPFVDACMIAYMQPEGLGYLYAFENDFDAVENVCRLDRATNPYDPK